MRKLEFTTEQMAFIKSVDNSNELVKLFKRLIYISGCSYTVIWYDIESDFQDMLDDILEQGMINNGVHSNTGQ